jgi:asparagine synthase (glutamine-hydrolysing)
MCGIVGLINRDGTPVDSGLLARMAAAIAHRGPDEEGAYADGPVGFHHKRLSIIDLKTGR